MTATPRAPAAGPPPLDREKAAFEHLARYAEGGDRLSPKQRAIVEKIAPGALERATQERQVRALSPDQRHVVDLLLQIMPKADEIIMAILERIAAMHPTDAQVEAMIKRAIPDWVRHLSAQGPQDGENSLASFSNGWIPADSIGLQFQFRVSKTWVMSAGTVYVSNTVVASIPEQTVDDESAGYVVIDLDDMDAEYVQSAALPALSDKIIIRQIYAVGSGEPIQCQFGSINIDRVAG